MRRTVAGTIIGMIMLLASAGVLYAYFSAVSTSPNNVFASGKMEMQLSKDNATFANTVSAAFGGTGLIPGSCLNPGTLYIKNTGTIESDDMNVSATNTNPGLASFLRLDSLTYDGNPVSIQDANTNGFMDLADLQTKGIANLPLADHQSTHLLSMKVCLDTTAGNAQQDQTNTMELTVTLDQAPPSTQ